ncbi:type II toxin-antitoxin system VapC family toxin [Bauldia sp.]|uniref:type II toxin-antitoxin system VapC family toxin n=1 Tax=Bauldia sp. TaxID=2575872 RepID=UPI003BAA9E0B
MTDVLVDTNVLLDIANNDPVWFAWSDRMITAAGDEGSLVINQVIYAELAAGFETLESLDMAMVPDRYRRESVPWDAAFMAGVAFLEYRRRGGKRSSPLPDFFIGAHAAVRGYRLLSRDRGYYRTYFPSLDIISPDARP